MRFVLTGGGTAGHINPALALAEELEQRGHEVFFAGTPDSLEARLVPEAGIAFQAFDAEGFDRARPLSLGSALIKLARSKKKAKEWLKELEPHVVVGFGGYVSLPVGSAAEGLGIPLVVHEQNSVMGMANRELAKHAQAVCLTYACAGNGIPSQLVTVTGNPVRRSVIEASREQGRALLGIPDSALMLLVFGGSRGARHINVAIAAMKDELLERPDLFVVHITGSNELEATKEALALSSEEEARYIVMGYQDKMGETLAAADAIVSRAGATSLAEISARAIPALLVPFPHATADHQTTNARAYVDEGCAFLISDDDVEGDRFKEFVARLIDEPAVRAGMQEKARAQKTADAAARLADVVELRAAEKKN